MLFLLSLVCLLNIQQDCCPIKTPSSCWAIKMFFVVVVVFFYASFPNPLKKEGGGGGLLDRVFVLYVLYVFSSHPFHCIYNKDENNSILRLFCILLCYRIASAKTLG